MKLKEYLLTGNLFTEIKKFGTFPFIDGKESVLNHLLIVRYGERELFSKFESIELNELGEMIATVYGENWNELLDFKNSGINPNLSSSSTITETITETGNRLNTGENLNKVSAYNSDSLIVNDGDSSEQSETSSGETVRALTEEKQNFQIAYNNLSLSQKTNIIKYVISDVSDFLTLAIY